MRSNRTAVLYLSLATIFVTLPARAQSRRQEVVRISAAKSAGGEETKQVKCTGKVVNAEGQPIAGAKVRLYNLTVDMSTISYDVKLAQELTTKADGASIIEAPADSDHRTRQSVLLVEKEGLAVGWANWDRSQDLDVQIKLAQPKVLAGRVVDESGSSLSGAEVSMSFVMVPGDTTAPTDNRYLVGKVSQELFAATTNAEGKFTFNRVPAEATAEFIVKKSGRATIGTFDTTGYGGGSLHYAPGQEDIKIEMPIEAKVEGVVAEKATGKPVGSVRLMLTQGQHQPMFGQEPVVSNEDGKFSMDALAAGKYIVQLVPSVQTTAEWIARPVEITAESGKTKSGVKVVVSKGGLLEVMITEAVSKKPLENAGVVVRHREGRQRFSTRSDANGVARLRLLPAEYRLDVHKQTYVHHSQEEPVTIKDNTTERIDVQLAQEPKITGVVRDQAGKPAEAVRLRIIRAGRGAAATDADGRFEVRWNPGYWGRHEPETAFYLVARHEERNLAAAVEVEEDTRSLDVSLVPGVILAGKVTDTGGKPIPQAKVNVMLYVKTRDGAYSSTITDWQRGGATTDAEGKFEVGAIPPEHKYHVVASAEAYGKSQTEVSTDDAVNNRVDVGQLALAIADLSVSGVVVDANDEPVAGAMIHAYGEGQPDRREIRTDAEGKFTIDKVCAGRIELSANVHGTGRLWGHVRTEGGATDVKILVSERGSGPSEYVPRRPPSLVGKPLPELKDVKIELSEADANDGMILVCFWDMEQRPSRHCIRQLAKQTEQLKQKGVTVVAVQASKVDENQLNEWIKKYNIPFPVGMIQGDEEKGRFTWGVRSLPWLILTDQKHVVRSNGFALNELNEKLKQISGD